MTKQQYGKLKIGSIIFFKKDKHFCMVKENIKYRGIQYYCFQCREEGYNDFDEIKMHCEVISF